MVASPAMRRPPALRALRVPLEGRFELLPDFRLAGLWIASIVVVMGVAFGGCGPSLRMVHEENAYYERCYAADVDPQYSVEFRRECWGRWLEHYTAGQPTDRVAYARGRYEALARGEERAPLPGQEPPPLDVDVDVDERDGGSEAPETELSDGGVPLGDAATGIAEGDGGGGPESPDPDSAEVRSRYRPPPPAGQTSPCDSVCASHWETCVPRCDGRPHACIIACQERYRSCQAGCL